MKNLYKLFGIIAIVVIIGFGMTACDDGGDEQQEEDIYTNEDVEVTTAGRLTITGLDSHNGTSIYAFHSFHAEDGTNLLAYGYVYKTHSYKNGNVITIGPAQYEQGTISGGQVTLKVYVRSINNDNYVYEDYAGNDQNAQFSVYTYNSATWDSSKLGNVTVSFSDGIASGVFEPTP